MHTILKNFRSLNWTKHLKNFWTWLLDMNRMRPSILKPSAYLNFFSPDVGCSGAWQWRQWPRRRQSRKTWHLEQPLRLLGLCRERWSTASRSSQWDRTPPLPLPPALASDRNWRTTCCLGLVILAVLSTQGTRETCHWCSWNLWGISWSDGKPMG